MGQFTRNLVISKVYAPLAILGVDDARRLADRRSACNDAMKIGYIP
jgi:hypothetical protein